MSDIAKLTLERRQVMERLAQPHQDAVTIEFLARKLTRLTADIEALSKPKIKPKKKRNPIPRPMLYHEVNRGKKPDLTGVYHANIAELHKRLNCADVTDDERAEIEADIAFWQRALSEVSI